jgi:hypothetical protein
MMQGYALVKPLVDNGYISTEQSNKIQKRMDEFAQRHQLMTLLVQKGLADGTITLEQAQVLLPKRP